MRITGEQCFVMCASIWIAFLPLVAESQVTSVTFSVRAGDRVAYSRDVQATFTFTPSAVGTGPTVDVTLNYPSGFFDTSATPTAIVSTVDTIMTPGPPGATSIVLDVSGVELATGTAVTVTLVGCTLGIARAATASVTVQTSADPIASSPAASCGVIGGAVTAVTFTIASIDREPNYCCAATTFSFTPSSGGANPSTITLNYPTGFYTSGKTWNVKEIQVCKGGCQSFSSASVALAPTGINSVVMAINQNMQSSITSETSVSIMFKSCQLGVSRAATDSVTLQTSADPVASVPPVSCGDIGYPVDSVALTIAAADRVAGRGGVAATFTFKPGSLGAGPSTVTLTYPSGFFATSPTPSAAVSTAGTIMAPGPPGATSIVLAVSGTALAAGTAVTVTLVGCTLGIARAATASVTVQTSADPTASSPAESCGVIGGAVTTVALIIAAADRVAGRVGVAVTFTFTPSAGGAGPSTVTLTYPSGFFATSPTPSAAVSTAGTIMAPGPPGATSIVLAVSGTALAAGTSVTVTLVGCTLGIARAATASVTVQTNRDPTASSPAESCGVIGGAVTNVTFMVAAEDRVAGRVGVAVTFTFTPSVGGAYAGTFTLNYPSGFFSAFPIPTVLLSKAGVNIGVGEPGASSIVLTNNCCSSLIIDSAVTVTLVGCTLGIARAATASVTVQTNRDPTASSPAESCGVIGGAVTTVALIIAAADRVAGRVGVAVTFTFTPSAGGAGPSTVTLTYPSGFFATSPTPSAAVSTAGTIMAPGPPGATSIVLAVSGTALAAGTAVTVTLVGCTLGIARAATASVTVQTSADPTASSPAESCGVIGGAVTTVALIIAAADRVAGRVGVAVTFTFTPSAGGAGPSTVTLTYPSGFFATSPTPSAAVSTAGTIMAPGPPGATSIVLAVSGTALAAGTSVTVTLVGCTLGIARAATASVTVQTSADPTASSPAESCGVIGGAVTWCG
jgi:hypothetical protein